jgi:hypothetical protein
MYFCKLYARFTDVPEKYWFDCGNFEDLEQFENETSKSEETCFFLSFQQLRNYPLSNPKYQPDLFTVDDEIYS